MVIKAFCACCQTETQHSAVLDERGELLLTCPCGRFIKTPPLEPLELQKHLAAHKAHNLGRAPMTKAQIAAAEAKEKNRASYLQTLAKAGIAS